MRARAASRLSLIALLSAVAIAGASGAYAPAQAAAAASASAQVAPAQAASVQAQQAAPPAFEVAAIKPNKSGSGGSRTNFNQARFSATNVTVKGLLRYEAYDITEQQIEGGPAWFGTDRFDIEAKMDDATYEKMDKLGRDERRELMHQLFRQLLTERFKLAVHWETKELPVYALVKAKNGAKDGPGLELSKATDGNTSVSSGNGKLTVKGLTMDKLAQALTGALSRELDRVVVNQTGLAGIYDLTLSWTPADRATADGQPDSAGAPGVSIFTALQEQLGLKLISARAPVQTLVIDHVEQPSED